MQCDRPAGGIYVLIIELPQGRTITIGALGEIPFDAGGYAYVGSALNGLQARIQRHQRNDKRLYWHVDYLLQYARVADVVTLPTDQDIECTVARELARTLRPIPRFGCSDCDCESHLFYGSDIVQLREPVNDAISSSSAS
jgi:Uri superfamily endonuclease